MMDSILMRLRGNDGTKTTTAKRFSDTIRDSLRANPTFQSPRKMSLTLPTRVKTGRSERPSILSSLWSKPAATPKSDTDGAASVASADERAPTFMVPDAPRTAKPSWMPVFKRTVSEPKGVLLSNVNMDPAPAPVKRVSLQADWGGDEEWILLFDNLLKSHTASTCRRECQCERHGNCTNNNRL